MPCTRGATNDEECLLDAHTPFVCADAADLLLALERLEDSCPLSALRACFVSTRPAWLSRLQRQWERGAYAAEAAALLAELEKKLARKAVARMGWSAEQRLEWRARLNRFETAHWGDAESGQSRYFLKSSPTVALRPCIHPVFHLRPRSHAHPHFACASLLALLATTSTLHPTALAAISRAHQLSLRVIHFGHTAKCPRH
eukprot:6182262-Pleurochrysis_carterae.AAC.5